MLAFLKTSFAYTDSLDTGTNGASEEVCEEELWAVYRCTVACTDFQM
jgi:hypothetical protein